MGPFPYEAFGWPLDAAREHQLRRLRQGFEPAAPPIRPDDPEEEERHFREVIEETKRRRAAGEPVFDSLFDEF
jgi:hypothetical protein